MDTREFVEADSATIKEKRKEIYTMVKDAEDREAEYKERIDYIPKA